MKLLPLKLLNIDVIQYNNVTLQCTGILIVSLQTIQMEECHRKAASLPVCLIMCVIVCRFCENNGLVYVEIMTLI